MKIAGILLILLPLCIHPYAQPSQIKCTVAPWFNNKKAAVSITFDDGISGQFTDALPLLNQYGFRSTFFVTVCILQEQVKDWTIIKAAADSGHEIASHTLTHPHFLTCGADSIAAQFIQSRQIIQQWFPSIPFLALAYPFGEGGGSSETDKAIRKISSQYFIGARATQNKAIGYNVYNFAKQNDDYFNVNSRMITDSASIAGFGADLDSTLAAGGWYVATFHGIANGWLIVKTEDFRKDLQLLDNRKKDLWIASFSSVLKYHKERNCSRMHILHNNSGKIILSLTDTLSDRSIWNQPLSVLVTCSGFRVDHIMQSGKPIPFLYKNSQILFNAMPGPAEIILYKKRESPGPPSPGRPTVRNS